MPSIILTVISLALALSSSTSAYGSTKPGRIIRVRQIVDVCDSQPTLHCRLPVPDSALAPDPTFTRADALNLTKAVLALPGANNTGILTSKSSPYPIYFASQSDRQVVISVNKNGESASTITSVEAIALKAQLVALCCVKKSEKKALGGTVGLDDSGGFTVELRGYKDEEFPAVDERVSNENVAFQPLVSDQVQGGTSESPEGP